MATANSKNEDEKLIDMVLRVLVVADLLVSKPKIKPFDETNDTAEQSQYAGVWTELQKSHDQILDV